MASPAPPQIFAPSRRLAVRRRMAQLQTTAEAPRYILEDMVDDVLDRLAFLRHETRDALIIGDWTGRLVAHFAAQGAAVMAADPLEGFDDEAPLPTANHDLIVDLGTLDTVNDLPGALIHMRTALAPGGLMIASLLSAGSLPQLRAAMLAADADRPSPRIHPQVDVRAGGQLLQRAGFADPVVDVRPFDVSFRDLSGLIADLRAQGLTSALARAGGPLNKAAYERARATFAEAGDNGRTVERFEILTLSGWRR